MLSSSPKCGFQKNLLLRIDRHVVSALTDITSEAVDVKGRIAPTWRTPASYGVRSTGAPDEGWDSAWTLVRFSDQLQNQQ
jgi:hypothetical protein